MLSLKKTMFLTISATIFTSYPAFACPDCDDEWCATPWTCICVPNVGRCPPPPPARYEYCNITNNNPTGDGKPSCTNCSSLLSGDAGKADCLARHQGNYVQDGACKVSDCGHMDAMWKMKKQDSLWGATAEQLQKASSIPKLLQANIIQVKDTGEKSKNKRATVSLIDKSGTKVECTYSVKTIKSKLYKGKMAYVPTDEKC